MDCYHHQARARQDTYEAGKAVVSRTGYKGARWREVREMVKNTNQVMREQRELLG